MCNLPIFGILLIVHLSFRTCFALSEYDLPWTYICQDGLCEKTLYSNASGQPKTSMEICRLACSSHSTLWPAINGRSLLSSTVYRFCVRREPTLTISGSTTLKDRQFIDFHLKAYSMPSFLCPNSDLQTNATRGTKVDGPPMKQAQLNILVEVRQGNGWADNRAFASLDIDESYNLRVEASDGDVMVHIKASNRYGTRHAFTTLGQLMVHDTMYNCMATLSEVIIDDSPQYAYCGVHIDTSRNFISIANIKVILDVMSMFKMNTLHFHITDSHSFPYDTPAQPEMAFYGAYRKGWTFTRDQISELTEYADMRGVRIIPEIDMPAHTGFGWQWGEQAGLGKLVLCEGISPWEKYCLQPPCGQLNIVNPNVYKVLETILSDLYNATSTQIFHMGGDEVKFECWNVTEEIVKNLTDGGYDLSTESYHQLWGNFTTRSYDALKQAYSSSKVFDPLRPNPLAIFWTSTLTTKDYLDKFFDPDNSVIMYWENLTSGIWIEDILKGNYRVILANFDRSYLDCGFPHYVNDGNIWCSPYKDWTEVYSNDYTKILEGLGMNPNEYRHLILGGEVLLWTEVADDYGFLFKFIPRLLASAERWWTYPDPEITAQVRTRIDYHQLKLATLMGPTVRPDMLTPQWCVQHPRSCYWPL